MKCFVFQSLYLDPSDKICKSYKRESVLEFTTWHMATMLLHYYYAHV